MFEVLIELGGMWATKGIFRSHEKAYRRAEELASMSDAVRVSIYDSKANHSIVIQEGRDISAPATQAQEAA